MKGLLACRCYTAAGMPALRILFKKPTDTAWDSLGRFTATPEEHAELTAILARHENPFDALPHLPRGLLWDSLDVLREGGYVVKLEVTADG